MERAIKWLVPGEGRLGMVVPDGLLNNSGESTRCPALRRFLFRNTQILAIVSLPDYAFRKSGAQNKTSLLFVRRWSDKEKNEFDSAIEAARADLNLQDLSDLEAEDQAISRALEERDYYVFLAEAEAIGYTPAGAPSQENDLYEYKDQEVLAPLKTILGQYRTFKKDPKAYKGVDKPPCIAISASRLYAAHPTHRIDPKYHIFKHAEEVKPPHGLEVYMLKDVLRRRKEKVIPNDFPDQEFKTVTLTQEGELTPREAGKGKNPPDWHGAYFKEGQKWNRIRSGDILISRIDLWKGCIGVVPDDFDGAIVTDEFPSYHVRIKYQHKVDVKYLKLLLRTSYFQRALRAINTGHSNRRRTQETDFLALKVFLPEKRVQEKVVAAIEEVERRIQEQQGELKRRIEMLDEIMLRHVTSESLEKLLSNA
ncbi:hypothetical protein GQ464_002185 [Rhodocaloribacter litoris]|uniref:hypothetical protein n=1 Tax=Rhodocaloribacter litoris TaxID=2558931 RepID=UPI001E5F7A60|nr:hypothetical protein [Rhodocaloribacter litoris]QXD15778.1 hypothetical protein GQ464_002185 [Rhodocaloribacter litoris]